MVAARTEWAGDPGRAYPVPRALLPSDTREQARGVDRTSTRILVQWSSRQHGANKQGLNRVTQATQATQAGCETKGWCESQKEVSRHDMTATWDCSVPCGLGYKLICPTTLCSSQPLQMSVMPWVRV